MNFPSLDRSAAEVELNNAHQCSSRCRELLEDFVVRVSGRLQSEEVTKNEIFSCIFRARIRAEISETEGSQEVYFICWCTDSHSPPSLRIEVYDR